MWLITINHVCRCVDVHVHTLMNFLFTVQVTVHRQLQRFPANQTSVSLSSWPHQLWWTKVFLHKTVSWRLCGFHLVKIGGLVDSSWIQTRRTVSSFIGDIPTQRTGTSKTPSSTRFGCCYHFLAALEKGDKISSVWTGYLQNPFIMDSKKITESMLPLQAHTQTDLTRLNPWEAVYKCMHVCVWVSEWTLVWLSANPWRPRRQSCLLATQTAAPVCVFYENTLVPECL